MGNSGNSQQSQIGMAEQAFEHRHLGHLEIKRHEKYGDCFLKIYHFADQMMSHEKLRRFQARMKKYNSSESVITLLGA